MPSLFRSEEMTLWQVFLQTESAYGILAELGEVGCAHFRDLNPDVTPLQRKFFNEVKRCDDLEIKLAYIEKETRKLDIQIEEVEMPKAPQPGEMIDLEAIIEKFEAELKEVNTNIDALQRNFIELTELKHVLTKTESYFGECEQRAFDDLQEVVTQEIITPIKFDFVAGVIHTERVPFFECMVWRVCQGNAFLRVVPIEEDILDIKLETDVRKSVFIIFSQGDQYKTRIKKICEGFRASVYPLPETSKERDEMVTGVTTRVTDLSIVLTQSRDHRLRMLNEFNKLHNAHFIQVRKTKAIYHILNFLNWDVTQKCLIGECWVPNYASVQFAEALKRAHAESGSTVAPIWNPLETYLRPPTHYQTNKFSGSFQMIVDSYGVANYREVNPATYTCITFPFLFAVMFGDAGHGFIMTLFALYLCVFEKSIIAKKIKEEMFTTIFAGRYIILLMGFFSMYTGLIYNDVFSKSINIFGSQWGADYNDSTLLSNKMLTLDPTSTQFYGQPYYFGVDPIWQMGLNKLNYLDSYKMKLSVILGVLQMLFGVILGIFNHIYFRRYYNIYLEWVPQIIFLMVMFGYLDMLIFWKWFKFTPDESGDAPNLLVNLINMYLGKDDDLLMYANERSVETILVIVAIVCVPWMLLIKPFVVRCRFNNAKRKGLAEAEYHELMDENGDLMFGEVFVHQSIHTIEYCLGCISNTASYLRLWALSLAHNQLSDVLWTLVMRIGFVVMPDNAYGGGVVLYCIFAFWAVLTISILLVMEGLSAFLHALRLHWVEFMNKFYVGDGYPYAPFAFKRVLSDEEE